MAAPSDPTTLDVEHLSIGYSRGDRTARVVNDVSFSIRPGEAYGLVGESGCGKTTVAMSLMRYLPDNAEVDDGSRVRFNGEDLLAADRATLRQWRGNRISMVYQNPGSALNPSMTIGDQVGECYRVSPWRPHGRCWQGSASPIPSACSPATRTNCPAASSNA
jgi:peptide/nickel transport system ATP-binding protein